MAKLSKQKMHEVDLSLIDEPQGIIRLDIDDARISELAQSISEIGLLQPITLRKNGDRFEVVYGHRRYLACKKLEVATIRSVITTMTDQEAAVSRATENLARVDLTPIEEAATFQDLFQNHGMTYERIAVMVGRHAGTIRRRIDMLRMPPVLQKALHEGEISITVAEELWPISDQASLEYYLSFCILNGATKETARGFCKEWKDQDRRRRTASGGGGEERSPLEPRPHYITCDLCLEPELIENAESMMICKVCRGAIREKQKEV
ncbi:MAG: hypothetical protein CEE41_05100 [Hadesarchaea archaeon B3_Hades]|nr:MAG: hypothetical protein CEE41_05100 [Hadesarchaea archaeon B3_Hades]